LGNGEQVQAVMTVSAYSVRSGMWAAAALNTMH